MQAGVTAIGERIKRAREARRLTLREIAQTTRISERQLAAIERDDFVSLPRGVFRRAYVRTLASAVGLDGAQLAREYVAGFEPEPPPDPVPPLRKKLIDLADRFFALPKTAIAGLAGIGALSAVVTFSVVAGRSSAGFVHTVPPSLLGSPAPTVTQPAAGSDSVDGDSPKLHVEIRPTRSCWVSASADGESVVRRLLQPDEHTVVDANEAITLRVGDAGAIDYSINGTPGRPLGRSGEVVTVTITPDDVRPIGSSGSARAAVVGHTD
jgi:cytoskeletal protein RodZ